MLAWLATSKDIVALTKRVFGLAQPGQVHDHPVLRANADERRPYRGRELRKVRSTRFSRLDRYRSAVDPGRGTARVDDAAAQRRSSEGRHMLVELKDIVKSGMKDRFRGAAAGWASERS